MLGFVLLLVMWSHISYVAVIKDFIFHRVGTQISDIMMAVLLMGVLCMVAEKRGTYSSLGH